MGNLAFITTKKFIKSYDIVYLLNQINKKRFDNQLDISYNCYFWKVSHKDITNDWIEIYQDGPRKLSITHPFHDWMSYVGIVFRNELGKLTDAILSDEGVEETWKPNPKKYPSYRNWIGLKYKHALKKNTLYFEQVVHDELQLAPNDMSQY